MRYTYDPDPNGIRARLQSKRHASDRPGGTRLAMPFATTGRGFVETASV
jgi:hypothetical protein